MGTSTEKFMPFILDNFCVLFCWFPPQFSLLELLFFSPYFIFFHNQLSHLYPLPEDSYYFEFSELLPWFFPSFFISLSPLSEKFPQLIFSPFFWVFPRTLFVLFDFVFIVSLFESKYPILTTPCMVSSIRWHFNWQYLYSLIFYKYSLYLFVSVFQRESLLVPCNCTSLAVHFY